MSPLIAEHCNLDLGGVDLKFRGDVVPPRNRKSCDT
jgi:hypothetical protein